MVSEVNLHFIEKKKKKHRGFGVVLHSITSGWLFILQLYVTPNGDALFGGRAK